MPLYEGKRFPLVERPKELKPRQLVFQVRFTNEIFTDYSEYLKRMNFYRRRVWLCEVTGDSDLTFEEALVSEKKERDQARQFPNELVGPVLSDVQYCMAPLMHLVDYIIAKFQEPLSEGCELYGKKNNYVFPCKVVKILEEDGVAQYKVLWLDYNGEVTGCSFVKEQDLLRDKLPFTRHVLESFIKVSTYRKHPWVIHESFAKKHGISTDLPVVKQTEKHPLQKEVAVYSRKRKNTIAVCSRKTMKTEDGKNIVGVEHGKVAHKVHAGSQLPNGHLIRYPIEDLLVSPGDDDPSLTKQPSPCRDFNVPMDCVGDLLMLWEFCTSFGRFLQLLPFSLKDFESALCHKDNNVLIAESHLALLKLLVKDKGQYLETLLKKKRDAKITLVTWSDYLCDFLEMPEVVELSAHCATIRSGRYGHLNVQVKLRILGQLVAQALETDIFREDLDDSIDVRQALSAARRDEALEDGRRKREEKRLKVSCNTKVSTAVSLEFDGNNSEGRPNGNQGIQNGIVSNTSGTKHALESSSGSEEAGTSHKRNDKKQRSDTDGTPGNVNPKRIVHKMMKDGIKEVIEKRDKEQRKEYLESEIEKRYVCTHPLGKDRSHNRYWFFRRDGRIFVESSDFLKWGYYCTKGELDALMESLNSKGIRERALKRQLQKYYGKICVALHKRAEIAAQMHEVEEDDPAHAFRNYFKDLGVRVQ
ncbi:hypothetical protein LIER_07295 [Lithospermum erythrorhizon]|uniref:DDT domain-containing protein n=1 Tax=Lithospermum erythrorhizon TaxID=34254 RepID=A0AAV3P7H7_LITER